MRKILVFILILAATGLFAADKPVKLWGYGNWFELSPKDWKGQKDMVTTFNEWSQKKFGVTWEYVGAIPKGQSWTQALAAYVGANGLPDVIIGSGGEVEVTNAFLEFVREKKLADLSKYFKDSKNYPLLAAADKEYLRAYMVNGKIMAVPGGGWHIMKDDPYSGGQGWIIRYDLMKKYGQPKTTSELTAFLQKVKEDKPTDLYGKPTIPMMIPSPSNWPGAFGAILNQAFGAGWGMTQSGKLMPEWATEEYGKGFTYLNKLYRDGLLDIRSLSNDGEWLNNLLRRGSIAVSSGGSVARYRGETLVAGIKQLGEKESAKAKELIAKQPVMMTPPVADAPGAFYNGIAMPTMISAKCPNIAGVMKFVDFLDGGEGMIMFMAGAGFLDEGWEWVDYPKGPIYWQQLGKEPGNRDLNDDFPWGSVINALGALSSPTSSSYYEWMYYNKFVLQQRYGQFGVKIGAHNDDDATALEWSKEYAAQFAPFVNPIPSYKQFRYVAPQAELTGMATAQQKLNEWGPKVLTAKTTSEFIDLYGQMMDVLVHCAPWKTIYETKQKEYEAWLKANRFDDRKSLPYNTPSRWYVDVVGWIRFPY